MHPKQATPSRLWLSLALLAAAGLADPVAAQYNEMVVPADEAAFSGFCWDDDFWWSDGLPDSSQSVYLVYVMDEFGDSFEPEDLVQIFLGSPVTVADIETNSFTDLRTDGNDLTVLGSSSIGGFLDVAGGTVKLGDYAGYDAATKSLNAFGTGFIVSDEGGTTAASLEIRGADIVVLNTALNLFGANTSVRDQNTGVDAFVNLAENHGGLALDAGAQIITTGNFLNNGSIDLNLNPSTRVPVFTVSGNLVNNGEIELRGNTSFSVAGGYSGSGSITTFGSNNQVSVLGAYVQDGGNIAVEGGDRVVIGGDLTVEDVLIILRGDGTEIEVTGDILQTGGKVDTGPSGVDASILRARSGVYQNNACISGEGRLVMGSVTVNNSFITPGNTPGELEITGDLSIVGASDLEIELGGTVAGDSYDVLAQSGGASGISLDGTLTVRIIDDFACELVGTDSFAVVTSDMPIAGSFTNAASGSRVADAGGLGTFLVTYGAGSSSPGAVVLSDFVANAVPAQSFADWAVANSLPAGMDGPFDDPDLNGVVSLLEYATGSSSGTFSNVAYETGGGEVVFTFGVPKSVTGVDLTSEVSTTLEPSSWIPGPVPQALGTTAAKQLYSVSLPTAGAGRQFVRLRVAEAPEVLVN